MLEGLEQARSHAAPGTGWSAGTSASSSYGTTGPCR
jgi:hypothetical protein